VKRPEVAARVPSPLLLLLLLRCDELPPPNKAEATEVAPPVLAVPAF
jgi:hypothetical protein